MELITNEQTIPSDRFHSTITSVAPEVFTQDYVDKSMDIWALGVLLFNLVYGEPLYDSEDIVDGSFVEICERKEGRYGLKRKRVSK